MHLQTIGDGWGDYVEVAFCVFFWKYTEAYLEPGRTSAVERFCENSKPSKFVSFI